VFKKASVVGATNGCLQQIAANRFSIPQDVIAILLQGFVLPACFHRFITSSGDSLPLPLHRE
jgi:hypothetical protein